MIVRRFLTHPVPPAVIYSHHKHKEQAWGLTGAFGQYITHEDLGMNTCLKLKNIYLGEILSWLK
jgi:hypothetical protein